MLRVLNRFLAAGLALLLTAALARAEAPPDPLRLVSDHADCFMEVKQPARLAEFVSALPHLREWEALAPVKEAYDSTNIRRFLQMVGYFEKELGAKWPALLDRLAGGGIVLTTKIGAQPAPALLIVQGKDPETTKKFARLGLEILVQELARQESKDLLETHTYRQLETVRIGKDFHAAVLGSTLIISNAEAALQHALDLHLDGPAKSLAQSLKVAEARRLQPGQPLARIWINMEPIRKLPQAKDVYALPRDNFLLTINSGALVDVLGRAPYVCVGLYGDQKGITLRGCAPCGRDGMSAALSSHVPAGQQPGSRPLLQPHDTLMSSSYYLDVAKFWENRAQLFKDKQVKSFEEFDKNSGRFLAGTRFSKLASQAGPYHRLVVVHQQKRGYKIHCCQHV